MEKMTTEQAINVIINATAQVQTDRQGHQTITQAIQTIQAAIPKAAEEKEE